jgi:hypothetical protein
MIEIISAVATALVVIVLAPVLSRHFPTKLLAATILCSIAFIYVGFSLKDNQVSSIILEVSVAIIFYFIAIIGYSKYRHLIAFGIGLHGIWDIFHYKALLIRTAIPDYWPLYCLVIDFLWGVYFFILFKRQEKQNVQSSSGYL